MSGPIFIIINPDLWLKTAAPQNSRGPTMPLLADPIPNAVLGKGSGIMQYIELSPVAAFLLYVGSLAEVCSCSAPNERLSCRGFELEAF